MAHLAVGAEVICAVGANGAAKACTNRCQRPMGRIVTHPDHTLTVKTRLVVFHVKQTWSASDSCSQGHVSVYAGGMRRKLYRADLAELAGIAYDSIGRANPPAPDGHDLEAGHARPWWHEATAKAWLANRPGKGWKRGRVTA